MEIKAIKLFLRLALAAGFANASIDRFNNVLHILNPQRVNWGNWNNFIDYSATLMPWFPHWTVVTFAIIATICEISFSIFLIIGWKVNSVGNLSGILLLLFALSMSITVGFDKALSYSVFAASAAGFALGTMKVKFLEF